MLNYAKKINKAKLIANLLHLLDGAVLDDPLSELLVARPLDGQRKLATNGLAIDCGKSVLAGGVGLA